MVLSSIQNFQKCPEQNQLNRKLPELVFLAVSGFGTHVWVICSICGIFENSKQKMTGNRNTFIVHAFIVHEFI